MKKEEEKKGAEEHQAFSLQNAHLQNTFQGYKKNKQSSVGQTHIMKDKLTVSKSHQNKEYGLDTEVLRVSFNVILVTMDP